MNANLKCFYFTLFFFGWIWGSVGCSSEDKPEANVIESDADNPIAIVVKQRSDSASVQVADHLMKIFDYTKISAETNDLDLLGSELAIPSSVRLLCLTVSDLQSFTDSGVEKIIDFVASGNTLFITNPAFEERFNFLTGIKKDAEYQQSVAAEGLYFKEKFFPHYGNRGFKLKNPFYHNGLASKVFSDRAEVIASAFNARDVPVILKNSVGKGATYYFNSTVAYDKLYRGLLLSIILPSLEGISYPVANIGTIFLDDFPLPLYDQKRPPIDWEYDVTEEEFITDIWWPDMQHLADSLGISYTAMLAFNYNANIVPPFDFREWNASNIPVDGGAAAGSPGLAQSVKNSRHELGFHGYNHFSLLKEDWPNQAFMKTALKAARKRWRIDNLGPLPQTYVPPTNEIDSTGIEALSTVMPNIQYISSLYLGEVEDGGGREFGPEPYNPNLYDYPRITSGFMLDEEDIFNFHSLYLLTGIWTHFVHPDDVFQVSQRIEDNFASRNPLGLGWHNSKARDYGLYDVFKNRLDSIEMAYPLIQYKSVNDAVPQVKEWNRMRVKRGRADSLFYTTKLNQYDESTSWFVYADSSNADSLRGMLNKQATNISAKAMRGGYLFQFTSRSDSLLLPDYHNAIETNEALKEVRQAYLNYLSEPSQESKIVNRNTLWNDTRLRDTRQALHRNPGSQHVQERMIDLAVEFQRIPLALDILERRLLNNEKWETEDIDRLLKYYGWEQAYNRAFNFLDELWRQYGDESIITMKEMMVERFGVPGQEFQTKWLKREYTLKPDDLQLLEKLVTTNQSQETWPQKKDYLLQMIDSNPASDSLYRYTLQRSFWYGSTEQTLELLDSFPETANPQLQPLAADIANLYAYTVNDYSKALSWAKRAENYPAQPQLQWLLQQKRFKAFIEQSDRLIEEQPSNDSLRVFVGQQLIYNGFYDEGYIRLYPLFESGQEPASARELVHTEIGYLSYGQKKQFYRTYPAFFSASMKSELEHQYRTQEGIKAGATADYSSDNFDNRISRIGVFTEWGNRQKYLHRVIAEQSSVQSDVNGSSQPNRLTRFYYQYQQLWPEEGWQLTAGAGGYYVGNQFRPDAKISSGYAYDSTYTSIELKYKPKLTETALAQDINEAAVSLYREDFWRGDDWQTSVSFTGRRYSNNVTTGEALGRIYHQLPFSTGHHGVRAIAEISYSDASRRFSNGVPYYTPDDLFIQGIGVQYRYRDLLQNPDLSLELELLGKRDSQNGYYIASSTGLNAHLFRYWNLSLNASFSSSSVYRYNQVGLSISYLFPKQL